MDRLSIPLHRTSKTTPQRWVVWLIFYALPLVVWHKRTDAYHVHATTGLIQPTGTYLQFDSPPNRSTWMNKEFTTCQLIKDRAITVDEIKTFTR